MVIVVCRRALQSPGGGAHNGDPRRERGVQLPRGVPGPTPGTLRPPVGEEGRRHGTISGCDSANRCPFSALCP